MSYTALYRKFRPDNYEDVKGQDHITTTLRNQIVSDRIGHAYLFCGTRGTGKTTIAKIFAKAVNCQHPVNGNPCNECENCKNIKSGVSMNVIEMDAASNNGVDDVRQIVEEVQYRPTSGRYKVYIIDEVHMLSNSAFNALLKTLEEPPEYVIFILATTEVHKLPITILSRCQRYDFKHITIDTIKDRLKELADIENMKVEDKALRFIAKTADGSMRDALSLLDQCEAFCMNDELTYDKTLEILGAVDTEVFSNILRAVIDKDTIRCIGLLEDMVNLGRDLSQFVVDLTWYLRNILLMKTSGGARDIIDMSSERLELLEQEARMLETEVIIRYIRILSELTNQIKYSSQKRVLIEIALIKLTQPSMEKSYDSLVNRVADLEKKIEAGAFLNNEMLEKILSSGAGDMAAAGALKTGPGEANGGSGLNGMSGNLAANGKSGQKLEMAVPGDMKEVADNWYEIIRGITGHLGVCLRKARLSLDKDAKLCIVYESSIDCEQDNKQENIDIIKEAITKHIHKAVNVEFRCIENGEGYDMSYMELIEKNINFKIEEITDEDDEEEDF